MTTKAELLKVIRANCIDCVVGQISFIEDCGGQNSCKLFKYRFGVDPAPARRPTKAGLEALEKGRVTQARNRKKSSKTEEKK